MVSDSVGNDVMASTFDDGEYCDCKKKVLYNTILLEKSSWVFVVPSKWLYKKDGEEKLKCWYPKGFSPEEASDIILRHEIPDKNSDRWVSLAATRIGLESGLFCHITFPVDL